MNNYYNNNLDLNKINDCTDTISSLDSCLKITDLSSYIIEIEDIIKSANFEHNNFITNYKNEINSIIDDIEKVKKEVSNLSDALSRTITTFQKNAYTDEDIKELSTIYQNTDFTKIKDSIVNFRENIVTDIKNVTTSGNITRIPPAEKNTTTNQELKQPYSTVPIGLGIAAAGISASVGAVIVNEHEIKNAKHESNNLPKYNEYVTYEKSNKYIDKNQEDEPDKFTQLANELNEAYKASRDEANKSIYYDNPHEEYFKDE